jgi:hypothetical protein
MLRILKELDQLLRGELTQSEALSGAIGGRTSRLSLRRFLPMAVGLGAIYGFFMGWYALALNWGHGTEKGWSQLVAGMIKLPALFLLTLLVTFPSLYVFSALVGARLGFLAVVRLLVAAIVVNLAVAASLGTILGFFTLSTTSYPFIVVLNVVLLAIAGIAGLGFLLRALRKLQHAASVADPDRETPGTPQVNPADTIFYLWLIIYSLVGMQMGWLLRPFIGHPNAAFEWFRNREGNFFQGLFENIQRLVGGS